MVASGIFYDLLFGTFKNIIKQQNRLSLNKIFLYNIQFLAKSYLTYKDPILSSF